MACPHAPRPNTVLASNGIEETREISFKDRDPAIEKMEEELQMTVRFVAICMDLDV